MARTNNPYNYFAILSPKRDFCQYLLHCLLIIAFLESTNFLSNSFLLRYTKKRIERDAFFTVRTGTY